MDKNLKGLATETWVLKKLSRLYGAGSSVNMIGGDDSLRELFQSLFEKENVGTESEPIWVIKAKLPLYSLGEISAFGRSSGEGGGGTGGGGTWGSITGTISNQSDLIELLNAKQNTISDLSTIRANALNGATAYGWGNHASAGYLTAITKAMVEAVLKGDITSHTHSQYLTSHQDISGKQDVISDLSTIRSNASNGASAYSWGNHASAGYAKQADHNNLIASGNEFTFASSAFNGYIWLNYRTAGGLNGAITDYKFGDGKGGLLWNLSDIASNASNGASAYSWGNHASAGYAANSDLTSHTGNTTVHITSNERTIWNATYTLLNELFAKETVDSTTVIKAKFPFYSVGEVSAYGLSSGEGGGASISSISTDYINNLQ